MISNSYGDMVVLNNGESLSGTFSRIRENMLVFRTSLQGQMITPLDNVRSISAGTPLFISMMDDRVYYGRLAIEEGAQVVNPLDGGSPIPIPIRDIKETLPIPTPTYGTDSNAEEEYRLNASPGLQLRKKQAPADSRKPAFTPMRPPQESLGANIPPLQLHLSGEPLLVEKSKTKKDISQGNLEPTAAPKWDTGTALTLGLYETLMAALGGENGRWRDAYLPLSDQQEALQDGYNTSLRLHFNHFLQQRQNPAESTVWDHRFVVPGEQVLPDDAFSPGSSPGPRLHLRWTPRPERAGPGL